MQICLSTAAMTGLMSVWLMSGAAPELRTDTVTVRAGEDLQAALDAARPGDTILVQAGATFTGNFVLPAKDGADYITVRSSTPDEELPAPGVRIGPDDAPKLAGIRSPNTEPAIRTAPGAHHWRLLFLELGPGAEGGGEILALGNGSSRQDTLDEVPHHLQVDRCYIHGAPGREQKRGIAMNSASTSILSSYISDIKADGQDSQAIAGWNGPGPFEIVNNYLEAAGENFMLGGGDPAIEDLVPSDLTFRRNHVTKPTAWRTERWDVKNLFELKNAQRVLVEHNVFEHNWEAAQPGSAIVLTPRNQGGGAPWSVVQDVVFRNNVVRHVAAAFNILGHDNNSPSRQTARISIAHNVVYDVNADTWGGSGAFLLIGDGPSDISVVHNTVVQSGSVVAAYGRPTTQFVFRDNIVRHNEYGIKGDGQGTGIDTIAAYFPRAVVTHNVFAGGPEDRYPEDNLFPSIDDWEAQFVDLPAGRFGLTVTSPFRRASSDGSAAGANVEDVLGAARAALAGNGNAHAVPRRPPHVKK